MGATLTPDTVSVFYFTWVLISFDVLLTRRIVIMGFNFLNVL